MRFLKADKIFNGEFFISNDSVLVINDNNLLHEIITLNDIDINNVENFNGIITPGFINTHCHLELSHLKNKIPKHTGIPHFAIEVIKQRNMISADLRIESFEDANNQMWNNGIVAVGDISNSDDSFQVKEKSKILYHTFIELLGFNPINSNLIFNKGIDLLNILKNNNLKASLSAHAPYSCSNELIDLITFYNHQNKLPFCIHNQESLEENNFFMGKKSEFDSLYQFLKIDISWFIPKKYKSLITYKNHLTPSNSILVHNTYTKITEIESVSDKNLFWCFCPSANNFIENKLPNFSLFINQKDNICIGTDSLASNLQLDLIVEANVILNECNQLKLIDVLKAITINGAKSLGLDSILGKFILGKNTGLNLIEYKQNNLKFLKKII